MTKSVSKFSIKFLLGLVAAAAFLIWLIPILQHLYWSHRLVQHVRLDDPCKVCDVLDMGELRSLDDSWVNAALKESIFRKDNLSFLVLSSSLDVNQQMEYGMTSLMYAAKFGNFRATKQLAFLGADASLVNDNDETALEIAIANEHSLIADFLRLFQSPEWFQVLKLEEEIDSLIIRMGETSKESLSKAICLPENRKFKELNVNIDLQINELIWFRASENCLLGISESGTTLWMLFGQRIPESES